MTDCKQESLTVYVNYKWFTIYIITLCFIFASQNCKKLFLTHTNL